MRAMSWRQWIAATAASLLPALLVATHAEAAAISLISNDSSIRFGIHYVPTPAGLMNGAVDHITDDPTTSAPTGTGTWSASTSAGLVSTTFDDVNNVISGHGFTGEGSFLTSAGGYNQYAWCDSSIASLTFSLATAASATLTGNGVTVGPLSATQGQPASGLLSPGTYTIARGINGINQAAYSFNLSLVPTPEPAILPCLLLAVPLFSRFRRSRFAPSGETMKVPCE